MVGRGACAAAQCSSDHMTRTCTCILDHVLYVACLEPPRASVKKEVTVTTGNLSAGDIIVLSTAAMAALSEDLVIE